ncbi:MAG: hypothetical protein V1861_02125 [Candidatus Micrarchaeota archaeon]
MENEEEVQMPMQARPQMPPMVKAAALMMTGEFVLIIGGLFVLLGLGAFITDFLKIKGSGEVLVGLFLCAFAFALFLISGSQMPKPGMAQPGAPQAARKGKPDESGSYR